MTPSATSTREGAERQDALRLLLRHPLVTADGPHAEAYRLVRPPRDALGRAPRQQLGYRLVVESGFARLYKAGLGAGRARQLRRASGSPFSPRAYAYLALCCAVLLTGRQQVLLSGLVEQVRNAAAEAGVDLGDDSQADRRAFVAALRQLVAWGVLVEDDGTVSAFADDASAEALLFVRRDLVRHLLAVPLREVETPDELVIRVEGVAAIDPRDELTDEAFPRGGTLGHAALLAISELARRLRPETPTRDEVTATVPVPEGLLDEVVAGLLERHRRRWKQDYVDHPERLPRDVEDLLVAMGLLRRSAGGELRLAAVANRYAPEVVAPDTLAFETMETLP